MTNVLMYINSQAQFDVMTSSTGSSSYSVTISKLDLLNNIVTVVLQSNLMVIDLNIGETKLVDLDNDGVNDIKITFVGLVVNRVELTIISLNQDSID